MNLCTFVGRLTRDPEIYYGGESQMPVAKFVLAVDRNYGGEEGEAKADFFPCVAFDKRAEFAQRNLYKGIRIAVNGKMRNNHYTNKNGEKVYGTSLYLDNIEFADGRQGNGQPDAFMGQENGMNGGDRTGQPMNPAAGAGNPPSGAGASGRTRGQQTGARNAASTAGVAAGRNVAQPAGRGAAQQSGAASAGRNAAQPTGQSAGRSAAAARTGSAGAAASSGRNAGAASSRGAASGAAARGAASGAAARAASGGAFSGAAFDNGFMNIPDGVEDEGLPFN